MATNETKTCEPCTKKGLTVSATKYCTDCDEAQCSTCTDVHNTFKAFENHHVLSLEVCSTLKVDRNCSDHADMLLDYFCTEHDRLCCRQCIPSAHRSCDNVLPIEIASKNVRKSVLFDNVRDDMNDIRTVFTDVLKQRKQRKGTIRDKKQNIISETKQLKEKALSQLNQMDKTIQAKIETVFGKLLEEEENGERNIEKEKKIAENLSDQLALIEEHGSEIQLFSFLHQAASSLTCSATTLQDISEQKSADVKFEAADLFSGVSSMGKITVGDRELATAFVPLKLKSAQDLTINRKSPTQFQLERKLELPGNYYTGIDILKDGRLVLSYWKGTYLLLISADGRIEDVKIKLAGNPWGVAIHPDTDDVYVTLPGDKRVQVVNVQTEFVNNCSCPGTVYGISLIMDDKMVLGGIGKVYITTLYGNTLATIDVGSKNLYSIKLKKSSFSRPKEFDFFLCESDNNKIYIASITNAPEYATKMSIKHVLDIERAVDSVCGLEGDMYVICWKTNQLIRVGKDYILNEIVLEKGVLQKPYALTFSKNYSKLYVVNKFPSELLVFSCS